VSQQLGLLQVLHHLVEMQEHLPGSQSRPGRLLHLLPCHLLLLRWQALLLELELHLQSPQQASLLLLVGHLQGGAQW
jgi:hypothetical protein